MSGGVEQAAAADICSLVPGEAVALGRYHVRILIYSCVGGS